MARARATIFADRDALAGAVVPRPGTDRQTHLTSLFVDG
jgi:hypothetical protein